MILFYLPARSEMKAPAVADAVLQSKQFFFASGNDCIVTPAMSRVIDPERGPCTNICVIYEWDDEPTPEDEAEMQALMATIYGPAALVEQEDDISIERAQASAEAWLKGKVQ